MVKLGWRLELGFEGGLAWGCVGEVHLRKGTKRKRKGTKRKEKKNKKKVWKIFQT
jgi:hypothetical protein